jgi:serine/threonine protein phosphatase PrpC
MMVEISAGSDPGRERANNEDSVAFDAETSLCVLADGMGGHNAGEIASGMATAFVKSEMRTRLQQMRRGARPEQVEDELVRCVAEVNRAIFNVSRGNPNYSGMGTTLVAAIFHQDWLVLGHIGDSRCYRLRGGELQQITKDHSVQQEQADLGLILPAQAGVRKNIVTRAVGVDEHSVLEVNRFDVQPGDLYLMCSDGLSDMVDDPQIAGILANEQGLDEKVSRLIGAANEAGGHDNISVLLALATAGSSRRRLFSSARRALRGVLGGARR